MRNRVFFVVASFSLVFGFCLSKANAIVDFNDGSTHNIGYEISDGVQVDYQTPGMQTTLNLLNAGRIGWYLKAYTDSQINILGGSIQTDILAYDSSRVEILSGSIGDRMVAYDNSQVEIFGGSIGIDLYAWEDSQVEILGGSVDGILLSIDSAILTIYGSDFAVDGQPVAYGELTSLLGGWWENESSRHLTGTLISGEPIDNDFYIGYDAKIVLTPEPSTILLFGLGVVMFRKRF